MWADFHFLRPWWLLALLPAAALLYWLANRGYRRGDWLQVCDAELLPYILQEKPSANNPAGWIAASLAVLLSILALAGPTWQRLPGPAFRNDSALVIALDLSKSMNAADVKPSRLARARYKISDILRQRKDGQTALLVYGGDAFTVTPLTTDNATINSQLEALTTDIMPSPGSNTAAAIAKAVDLLQQAGLPQGHILLVCDAADDDSIAEAGQVLGDYRLSVLGLGTAEGAPIPQAGSGFLKDEQGNIVLARLDGSQLAELAVAGHGIYQPATVDDADIERLGSLFNGAMQQDRIEQIDLRLQQWDEKGPWLLLLILPWAALRFRKGLLLWLLLLLAPLPQDSYALDWQSLWQTQDQRAQQAFSRQQYQQAAEQFQDPAWRAAAQYKAGQFQEAAETLKDAQTADDHYNRGNALAKAGQLPAALGEYQQALKLEPKHQDAQANYEAVKKALEQQQNQQNQQDQDSQNKSSEDTESQDQSSQQAKEDQDGKQQKQPQSGQDSQSAERQPSEDGDEPNQQPSQQSDGKRPQPEPELDKSDEARRASGNPKPEAAAQSAQSTQAADQDEAQRTSEQLLKRIPDQPTGLLKRKFKYQYGQRDPPSRRGHDW